MKKAWIIFFVLIMIDTSCSLAEKIDLPSELTVIEEYAFYSCPNIDEITIPESVTEIQRNAFQRCADLMYVDIPSTVTKIGEDAFAEIDTPLLIRTEANSAAMQYAARNGIDYDAETKYRALLIAQPYGDELLGTLSDVRNMRWMLSSASQDYAITTKTDLTKEEIKIAIADTFADAKPWDVSLFHYSGHGVWGSGSLIGTDMYPIDGAELRTWLDQIPGRKIVIVDACHSGGLIGKGTDAIRGNFASDFIAGFSSMKSRSLTGDEYYVMASSHSSETSNEMVGSNIQFGLFTYSLVKGAGYDYYMDQIGPAYADANNDHVITFGEAYRYARDNTLDFVSTQNVQVWPDDCDAFGFIR